MPDTEITRGTFSDEYRWPVPWPGAGQDWPARERPPNTSVDTDEARAAMANLQETLASRPGVFWLCSAAADQLAASCGTTVRMGLRLLRDCPGSVLIEGNSVWCSVAAAGNWTGFKARVLSALPTDAAVTFDELLATLEEDADPTSTYTALVALSAQDRMATQLQTVPGDAALFYTRCTPRDGPITDYTDLRAARGAPLPPATDAAMYVVRGVPRRSPAA